MKCYGKPIQPEEMNEITDQLELQGFNCSNGISEEDIHQVFSQFGKIKAVRLLTNYGFVDFEDQSAREQALRNPVLTIKGHEVTVNVAAGFSSKR